MRYKQFKSYSNTHKQYKYLAELNKYVEKGDKINCQRDGLALIVVTLK